MEWRRLTQPEEPAFGRAMALYEASFPRHEQRLPDEQRAVLSHPEYHFTQLFDGAEFVGLLLYWEADSFCYVEHLCITESMRGKGCGSRALAFLRKKGKKMILEIDPPVDPVSQKRQRFYERAGYRANPYPHIHPPYRTDYAGHPLVVMSWPEGLSEQEYDCFYQYLKQTVMQEQNR